MIVETQTRAAESEPTLAMSAKTRAGLALAGLALGLGIWGDALLRETPWGINAALWLGAALLGLGWLARRLGLFPDGEKKLAGEGKWLAAPALLFAACLAWRDSATLQTLDGVSMALCLLVGVARTSAGRVTTAGALDYAADVCRAGLGVCFGAVPLLRREIAWETVPRTGWTAATLAVGRGLLLALPPLLLFGGLLAGADDAFARLVARLLHLDLSVLAGHLFWTLLLACLAAGLGRAALLPPPGAVETRPARPSLHLGTVETATVLGLLNVLFVLFVLTQGPLLFGGKSLVEGTPGLTYKDYVHQGFFQLVWVAALVLPLLLGLHAVQTRGDLKAHRWYAAQALVQVVLLLLILASALARMRLYVAECGLTELRLYTTAFMGWLGVVFLWFTLSVLRARRERFAFGAALAAFTVLLGLHVLNPDALIVRTNVRWAQRGHSFDAAYVASLSADAVPALVAALPSLSADAQQTVIQRVVPLWSRPHRDWRKWNWGRARAADAVHWLRKENAFAAAQ